jgi:hypothetical protein
VFLKRVRNQDITVKSKFALDRMWLKLAIDLNDLLRDGRVLWIGEWDTDGAFVFIIIIIHVTFTNLKRPG